MQAALENERCVAISCQSALQRDGNQADKHGHDNDHELLQFVESSQQRDYDERDQDDDDRRKAISQALSSVISVLPCEICQKNRVLLYCR